MVRGWKLLALFATIIVYIIGILVLSIVNLQAQPHKRMRNSRFLTDVRVFGAFKLLLKPNLNISQPEYHHNSEGSLIRRSPLQQLQWCSGLKFMGQKSSPYKLKTELETFPKFSSSSTASSNFQHEQQTSKLDSSSTISDNKNEFNKNEKPIALSSFPGSGKFQFYFISSCIFINYLNLKVTHG